ncbi:hypothetical protein DSECCO2_282720 [anaerobic digester metagenome]
MLRYDFFWKNANKILDQKVGSKITGNIKSLPRVIIRQCHIFKHSVSLTILINTGIVSPVLQYISGVTEINLPDLFSQHQGASVKVTGL